MHNCIDCFGEYKRGLSADEVKILLKQEFGKKWRGKWTAFGKFMFGQTIGMVGDTVIYYRCDVANFLRPKEERFFD